MKRLLSLAAGVAVLMMACNLPGSVTPAAVTHTPTLSEQAATGTPTETPGIAANVTCGGISLYVDPAVASGASCEDLPVGEGEAYFDVHPPYTRINLTGYVLSGRFFEPSISVFPVDAYRALQADYVNRNVTDLQALLGGAAPGATALPFLAPGMNAAQEFHAQYQIVSFRSGGGIRYLTQYAQYAAPINSHDMFYTYQGLTADNQFWVTAFLPVADSILPATADDIPGGQTFEQFSANFTAYIGDLTTQLNAQAAGDFNPALTLLDTLFASLTVQP